MPDTITIRYQSFQARVLLSELHLLDVLHFRRLIKLAEKNQWENEAELSALKSALPGLIDSAKAESEQSESAVRNFRRAHRGDHSPDVAAEEDILKCKARAARVKARRYQTFFEILKEDK